MAAERKLVSVLFVDVVGSTAMASEVDPEVVRGVMAALFERVRQVIEEHGGRVEKFIGDAVMAVFGIPRAHGDDAERALRAALAILELVPDLNAELGAELRVRIGVNTGEAVAGSGEADQFLVTGDAVNMAARLQQAAAPGEILAGALTTRLTRHTIEFDQHDPVVAKGKDEPQAASAVRGLRAVSAQLQTPYVGRERELRLLGDALHKAATERATSLLTVVGAAGVGKSRLVREALSRSNGSSAPKIRYGRCLPFGRAVAHWPLAEIVRQDAGIAVTDDGETLRQKLNRRLMSLFDDDSARHASLARLLVLLGIESPNQALPGLAPDLISGELASAMRRYLEGIAAHDSVVVVIDDLQWAAAHVITTLNQVVDRSRSLPLVVICIGRPELIESEETWSGALTRQTVLQLEPLTETETSELIERMLKQAELPEELRTNLIRRSEGNPLFCEEFVRMLIDQAVLVREGTRWIATDRLAQVRVPESIVALLTARLDSLPRNEKRALQLASVIGESFQTNQFLALAETRDEASEGLQGLKAKGLVGPDAARPESDALRFKHLLIKDVAYGSLAKAERARLHELIVQSLTASQGAEYADLLLQHAATSLRLSQEVRLRREDLQRRGQRAMALAIEVGEAALAREDAEALAAAADAAREAAVVLHDMNDVDKAHALLLQAEALYRAGRNEEARATGAEAAQLAESADQPGLAARAHICLANVGHSAGDYSSFRQGAARAEQLFRQATDTAGEIAARYQVVLFLYAVEGRTTEFLTEGRALHERALAAGERLTAARLLAWMAFAAGFGAAQRDLAEAYTAESARLFQHVGVAYDVMLAIAEAVTGWMSHDFDRGVRALEPCIEAMDDARRVTDALWDRTMLAQTLVYAGRFDEAERVLDRATADSEASGELHVRNWLYADRVFCAIARKDVTAAMEYARKAMASGAEAVDQVIFAQLALARAQAAAGEADAATTSFLKTIQLTNEVELPVLKADTALAFARFLLDQGRPQHAHSILEQALTSGWWTEDMQMFMAEAASLQPP